MHVRTVSADGALHRTIVWVVVDERDRVLVRSYRGPEARWYLEATSGRPTSLELDGVVLPVRVENAADAERIETTSRLLAEKYANEAETADMLREDVLDTTLELHLIARA